LKKKKSAPACAVVCSCKRLIQGVRLPSIDELGRVCVIVVEQCIRRISPRPRSARHPGCLAPSTRVRILRRSIRARDDSRILEIISLCQPSVFLHPEVRQKLWPCIDAGAPNRTTPAERLVAKSTLSQLIGLQSSRLNSRPSTIHLNVTRAPRAGLRIVFERWRRAESRRDLS